MLKENTLSICIAQLNMVGGFLIQLHLGFSMMMHQNYTSRFQRTNNRTL